LSLRQPSSKAAITEAGLRPQLPVFKYIGSFGENGNSLATRVLSKLLVAGFVNKVSFFSTIYRLFAGLSATEIKISTRMGEIR
jgi:hypothetical protein